LTPGAQVGDGRYRLLLSHGGSEHLQFWQALDTRLHRQVALTLVDPDGTLPDDQIQTIVSRTLQMNRLDMPGIARVLHVARAAPGAIVVSEWIRGATLAEVADTNPSPIGAARAMQSLAAAAEAAHRAGTALSIDHPSRVRVSIEGHVALAFPAAMPDATSEADLRAIGACLYALLVDRWPLPQSGAPSALAPAEVETEVRPKDPTTIDAEIPFQISAVATGSLRGCGGIRSATTLLRMLEQATAETAPAEPDTSVRMGFPPRLPGFRAPRRSSRWPMEAVRGTRRRGPLIGLAAGAAAIVAVVLLVAAALSRIVGPGITGISLDRDRLGLHGPASAPPPAPAAAGRSLVVKPVKATVFSPRGEADNPQSAGLAIDGDPATAWSTDTYFDAVPFPSFKDGVGLLLQLPQPVTLGAVTVDLDSAGTVVQIRSSPTATPAKLADTAALTAPVPTQPGHNSIPVTNPTPASNVLVWICTLGTTGDKSRADVSEVALQSAP
jgi:putative peptidoglycan lipid II flippase